MRQCCLRAARTSTMTTHRILIPIQASRTSIVPTARLHRRLPAAGVDLAVRADLAALVAALVAIGVLADDGDAAVVAEDEVRDVPAAVLAAEHRAAVEIASCT
jgi:hypothetical protein